MRNRNNRRPARAQIAYWLLGLTVMLAMMLTACQDENNSHDTSKDQVVIILATTTSTQDSGLLDALVPAFEDQSGFVVKVIAVGTGQALKMGESGDADVMLVHAPASEKLLVDNGSAVERRLVMHNDFVIAGPPSDPASIAGLADPYQAFALIAGSGSTFISRGDDSGTHKKELAIWQKSGAEPEDAEYLESGSGMAATLRIASEKQGYTLTDRATYLSQRETLDLEIMVEEHATLLNLYHTMLVNPEKWPLVNAEGAAAWSNFLLSDEGQQLIAEFGRKEFGQPLFFPDAGLDEEELAPQG